MALDRPEADEPGIIGETEEEAFPVVCKLGDELPPSDVRDGLPWLTVVTCRYNGGTRNGMPSEFVMSQMVALEHVIDESVESDTFCRHAYSRTGNGLKELVYSSPNAINSCSRSTRP